MSHEQELKLLRGLPASGKSTYAIKWVQADPENRIRINHDDIRFALYGAYEFTPKKTPGYENRVSEVEKVLIERGLKEGKSVLIDNTNLQPRYNMSYIQMAQNAGVKVTHKDFPISIEEAKRRNAGRERQIPEEVIDRMYRNLGPEGQFHLFPGSFTPRPFIKPATREQGVIFDMDGTLTRVFSIRHYVAGKKKDFDSFHRSSLFCPPNKEVLELAKDTAAAGLSNVIVTARHEKYRDVTEKWLNDHGVKFSNLYMRVDDDNRVDHVIKAEILTRIQEDYDIVHAVDDRPAVIKVWEAAGIKTTLVPGLEKEDDPDLDFNEEPQIRNLIRTGGCIRCGRPLATGKILGSYCARIYPKA